MNKKGFVFLAEQTLKIVIALICLGFLVYFLASLYIKYQNDKDLELAKESLRHLVDELNAGSEEVVIYNPEGGKWVLISWPYKLNILPKSCSTLEWENCICICKTGGKGMFHFLKFGPEDFKDNCDDLGICLEYNKRIIVEDYNLILKNYVQTPIAFSNPPIFLEIDYQADKVVIREKK